LGAVPQTSTISEIALLRAAIDRAAAFLSRRNLRLGLVLAGYVLDAASADEGRRLMARVPLPQRTLSRLFGKHAFTGYQTKLYGSPT